EPIEDPNDWYPIDPGDEEPEIPNDEDSSSPGGNQEPTEEKTTGGKNNNSDSEAEKRQEEAGIALLATGTIAVAVLGTPEIVRQVKGDVIAEFNSKIQSDIITTQQKALFRDEKIEFKKLKTDFI